MPPHAAYVIINHTDCEDCEALHRGDCPTHGPLQVLDETSAFDEASKQYTVTPIPAQFTIKSSSIPNAGNGVFAKQFIPKGTRMGPYQGNPVPKDGMDRLCNTSYLWEVSNRVSMQ